MRATRLSLIGTTVALAVLDVFLTARLFSEQRDQRRVTQERVELQQRLSHLQEPLGAAIGTASAPADVPARKEATATRPASERAALERQLKELTDPKGHEAYVNRQKSYFREHYAGLPRELRLTAEEANIVFDLLAAQAVKHELRSLRIRIAGREGWVDESALDEETQKQLAEALGPGRWQEFLEFREGLPERRRLAGLQRRLGSDALTADEVARLGEIMRDERLSMTTTLAGLGSGVRFETGYPEGARRYGTDRMSQLKFDEQQIERVAAHDARIRERAELFLTSEQLLRLKQSQEARLIPMRRTLVQRRIVDREVEVLRQGSIPP